MKKYFRIALYTILSGIALLVLFVVLFFSFAPQIGVSASGDRLARMEQSSNYHEGIFVNTIETSNDLPFGDMVGVMWEMLKGDPSREPVEQIKTLPFKSDQLESNGYDNIAITWLGHSSLLIKLDGKVILTDPVFSGRASMFSFFGPKSFNYSDAMTVEKLPSVDAVVISHDHYDHLDYETIVKLKDKVKRFFVPLGVGAHLEKWGVPVTSIVELNWWESAEFDDNIELTCTPARHFSGRGFTDGKATLWASWVIKGSNQRLYFGGDSGYFPGFKEIGEKYGPFDLALLECGAYNKKWHNIHMMPEETAQASLDLKGNVLMPIHWGKFNLALHPWKEPVERLTVASQQMKVQLCTPVIGELIVVPIYLPNQKWWEQYK